MDIYSLMYPALKLKPPIRLFEAFSGIGTQYMALKRITKDIDLVGFSEIDEPAIRSYRAIHGNNIESYGDITKMNEIPPCNIFTWSFPCTDLSKAGHRKGMTKETRSGLVYDVLRLLESTVNKPKVLIMENVPDLIQETFHRQFHEIRLELERMGYMNYVETLNAKHYGVAQNRNRVFMVSILGDYSYTFPKRVKLEKRLKDYLEDKVDEKYYLSDKIIGNLLKHKKRHRELGHGFGCTIFSKESSHANTITSRYYKDGSEILIRDPISLEKIKGIPIAENTKYPNRGVYEIEGTYYWIRKLTPRECWRLMGISDEDFDKAQAVNSNSQLYKQAGNAIVVDVFEAILREMIEV